MTAKNAGRATRKARRAVLFALIVASASTAQAQQTLEVQRSPFFANPAQSAPSPYVHQGDLSVTPVTGGVRSNPFMAAPAAEAARPLPNQAVTRTELTELIAHSPSAVVPVGSEGDLSEHTAAAEPIRFSLSDDGDASRADDAPNAAPKRSLPPMMVRSAAVNPVDASANASDSDDDPEQAIVAQLSDKPSASTQDQAKPESGEPERGEPVRLHLADQESKVAPAEAPTLVKLAPVIRLAKELPVAAPAESESAEVREPVARGFKKDGPSLVRRRKDALTVTPVPQAPAMPKPAAPIVENSLAASEDGAVLAKVPAPIQPVREAPIQNDEAVSRKLVAVAPPPLRIERTDSTKESMQPTARAVAIDPTQVQRAPLAEKSVAFSMNDNGSLPVDPNRVVANTIPQLPPPTESAQQDAMLPNASTGGTGLAESPAANAAMTTQRVQTASMIRQRTSPTSMSPSRRPVVLNLSRAQVRSLTIGGELRQLHVGDTSVCHVFQSGTNQIKLIGTGIGVTQLTVWADVDQSQPTRAQTFRIEVNESVDATGGKVTTNVDLLNDSVMHAFPRASVVVSQRGGKLMVVGHCDTEQEAKQIVRMVRKSCLIPVTDELKVR